MVSEFLSLWWCPVIASFIILESAFNCIYIWCFLRSRSSAKCEINVFKSEWFALKVCACADKPTRWNQQIVFCDRSSRRRLGTWWARGNYGDWFDSGNWWEQPSARAGLAWGEGAGAKRLFSGKVSPAWPAAAAINIICCMLSNVLSCFGHQLVLNSCFM